MQAQGSGLSEFIQHVTQLSDHGWAVHLSTVSCLCMCSYTGMQEELHPLRVKASKRIVRPAMCACPFGLHNFSSSSLSCGLACRARWGRATSSRRWEAVSSASWASSWRRCTAWSPTTSAASSPTPSTGLQTPLHVSQSLVMPGPNPSQACMCISPGLGRCARCHSCTCKLPSCSHAETEW